MRIFKYTLKTNDDKNQFIEIPDGHYQVLCAHDQEGFPHVWIEVSSPYNKAIQHLQFRVIPTGGNRPETELAQVWNYVGTCHCKKMLGSLVWHVYMRNPLRGKQEGQG